MHDRAKEKEGHFFFDASMTSTSRFVIYIHIRTCIHVYIYTTCIYMYLTLGLAIKSTTHQKSECNYRRNIHVHVIIKVK